MGAGGEEFNNLLDHTIGGENSNIDFGKQAEAMGANSVPYVVVIDTDPYPSIEPGGAWWDVVVPEFSERAEVTAARGKYIQNKQTQRAD